MKGGENKDETKHDRRLTCVELECDGWVPGSDGDDNETKAL